MKFINLLSWINSITSGSKKEPHSDVENSENPQHPECEDSKNTYLEGIIHLFRATVCAGILALPFGFSRAGYLGGTLGVILLSYVANYCASILVRCQREHARRNKDMVPSFQGTVEAAFAGGPKQLRIFGPFFMACTNICILLGQTGVLCIILIIIASNIKAALYPHLDVDEVYYKMVVFLVVATVSLIPNLKKLTIVSSTGNAVLLVSVLVVLYYDLREPISLEGKRAFGALSDLPPFTATVFFAGVTIAVVLPLQKEMARPDMLEGPCGVLNVSGYLYSAIYIFFGLLGYLRYGDDVAGAITLNLPSGNLLSRAVQVLLALSLMSAAPLHNYVLVSVIWNDYLDKRLTKNRTAAQYVLRVSLVALALMITCAVPNLKLLLSIVGLLVQCTLSTTLPVLIHLLTDFEQPTLSSYLRTFWLDAVALLLTAMVLVCGLSSLVSGS